MAPAAVRPQRKSSPEARSTQEPGGGAIRWAVFALPRRSVVSPTPHTATSPLVRRPAPKALETASFLKVPPGTGSRGGGAYGTQAVPPLAAGAQDLPAATSQQSIEPVDERAHASAPAATATKTPDGGGSTGPGPQHASSPDGRMPHPQRSTSSARSGPAGGAAARLPQHRAAPAASIAQDSSAPAATLECRPGQGLRPLDGRPQALEATASSDDTTTAGATQGGRGAADTPPRARAMGTRTRRRRRMPGRA